MDGNGSKQTETTIHGNCVNCHGLVRVPAKAPVASVVRCPHCSESFPLKRILDQAVPELELVEEGATFEVNPQSSRSSEENANGSDDSQQASRVEREVFIVPPQLSKGARRSSRSRSRNSTHSNGKRGRRSSSKNGRSDSSRSGKPSASSDGRFALNLPAASTVSTTPSTTIEAIKVVMGGILAIPIAYLLVFWIFKQDPLQLAPKIESVAPALVPAVLKSQTDPVRPASTSRNRGAFQDDSLEIPELDPDRVLDEMDSQ